MTIDRTKMNAFSALLVVLVVLVTLTGGVASQRASAAPSPEELCAPLEGMQGYDECVAAASQALDPDSPPVVVGEAPASPAAADQPNGLAQSEENLRQQRQLLWIIVAVVMVLVVVLVALSWRRSMKRMRDMFSPETLALMEQLIPPEVRAERPGVTVSDGLTEGERAMFRRQRNLIIVLLIVPIAVFVLLQIWKPSVDSSMRIGEVARWAPLVLALPALWWTRRRVAKAMRVGDDRWSVLGLHMDSTPNAVMMPRLGGGGLRATARGATILSGRRHGREVRVAMDAGALRTGVAVPAHINRDPSPVPGPGAGQLWASGGWLVLDRTGVSVHGSADLDTMLRDLQRAESEADAVTRSSHENAR